MRAIETFATYERESGKFARQEAEARRDLVVKSALGLAGEAGEVVELIKKWRFHGLPLDLGKLEKELGDVLWYLTDLARQHGLSVADIAAANVAKLEARYPQGFVLGGGIRESESAQGGGIRESESTRPALTPNYR